MNVFLVHGSFGKPFENWFPWLEEELANRNISCVIPSFPTPEHQNYSDWEQLMDYYCELGIVNKDTVLIGHSCGSIFLVHYLYTHNIKVKSLITVSGYNGFYSGDKMMDSLNESFYINSPAIDSSNFPKSVIAFYGSDDPFIPQEYLSQFVDYIGGKAIVVSNAGHFNTSSGYTKFETLLKELLTIE